MAVNPLTMTLLVLVYLAATLVIGYIGYKKTKNHEDYLVAGRDSHPVIIALSYGATFISTSAIIGFGGQAANLGMSLIWLTVLNIGVGILLAFVLPISIIARATAMFMGLCACAFLPAFAIGVYAKAPSTKAALYSMVTGAVIWFVWTAFFHAAEAKPLGHCQAIFGKVTILGAPWTAVDPIVITLPVSFIVVIIMQMRCGNDRPAPAASP